MKAPAAVCAFVAALGAALVTGKALADVNDGAISASRPPAVLSQFGFFSDPARQVPVAGVLPFSIRTPLFSDHATKLRFVYVPEDLSARYDERETFDFPVGSALIKTFAFAADLREPDKSLRLIETRVLLRKPDGWDAWAYLWNEDQTDAKRLVTGKTIPVSVTGPDGAALDFDYSVPNKNQCKGCHAIDGEVAPLGPKARNLNGNFAYASGPVNQLERWISEGILEEAPDAEAWPEVPGWMDEDASVEKRARAWLDVNCAHCHRRRGPASNSGLFLTWHEDDPVALGIGKRPAAAGRGSFGLEFDIVPGDPDASILYRRVESVEPGVMMPELGRSLRDEAALELLRAWITALR